MLSNKVKDFCRSQGWWYDDASQAYETELGRLGIDLESECAEFYLHAEDGPTFLWKGHELYQLCWFSKYTRFDMALAQARDTLGLGPDYVPLDSFEGEGGYFYNINTGSVLNVSLGQALNDYRSGNLKPQWGNFNDFIEFYFGLG